MTNLLHINDKFVTLHTKCSKIPVNLIALYKSCTKFACCSSELIFTFLCAGSSIQNASEKFVSCIHLSFVNFALDPTSQSN
jgi:hypothetical protein